MNTEVDPEQMNSIRCISQTNEHYACSVFVCSLPTLLENAHKFKSSVTTIAMKQVGVYF